MKTLTPTPDRLADYCLADLSRVLGKRIPVAAGTTYSGASGQFASLIDDVHRALETHFASAEGKADSATEVYASFAYALLAHLFRRLAINDGFDRIECQHTRRLIRELATLSRDAIAYHHMPLLYITRILSYLNYSDLPIAGPSLELGISDGLTSNFVWRDRSLTVGCDPAVSEVVNARKYGNHKQHLCVDARRIPFQDGVFGTIVAMNCVYHCDPREEAIREMARVLAPGGVLAFDDVTENVVSARPFDHLLESCGLSKSQADFRRYRVKDERYLQPSDYRELLEPLGFETIECTPFMAEPLVALAYLFFDLDQVFMRGDLRLPSQALGVSAEALMAEVIAPLLATDRKLCDEGSRYGCHRVVARKAGTPAVEIAEEEVLNHLRCPECHAGVERGTRSVRCRQCLSEYPVVNDVPLMIPFYVDHYDRLTNS